MQEQRFNSVLDVPMYKLSVGFAAKLTTIVDPFLSDDGFARVDPRDYYGFKHEQTGGGCTALTLIDEDGGEVLLTDGQQQVPEPGHVGPWYLGYKNPSGEVEWEFEVEADGSVTVRTYFDDLSAEPEVVPVPRATFEATRKALRAWKATCDEQGDLFEHVEPLLKLHAEWEALS